MGHFGFSTTSTEPRVDSTNGTSPGPAYLRRLVLLPFLFHMCVKLLVSSSMLVFPYGLREQKIGNGGRARKHASM